MTTKESRLEQAWDRVFGAIALVLLPSTAVFILYILTLIPSWGVHAHDRAALNQIAAVIAINQEEYDKASIRVSKLEEGGTTFRLNADTPVASMVTAQLTFAERLVEAKVKKTKLLVKIISRCNGPWAPVVWVTDDVTCAEYRKM